MKHCYKKSLLDNGLKVVTFNMPQRQSLSLGIWIKAGGRFEDAANKGISHFLEHLLFKGSKKYSCRRIKESIEGIGGSLNAFTSEELTCYLVKLPAVYLDLALDILSDMVLNPTLPEEEVEKERTVILEEIKMYKDLPQSYVHDLLDGLLWPGQPLGMSIAGSFESVAGIKQGDVCLFRESHYTAPNIVISAAGRLEHEKLLEKIGKIFSSSAKKQLNQFLPAHDKQDKPQLKILHKETEQSHLAVGFHSLKRDHPKRYALSLLHVILGANMSSRLFNEVREKRGLAYQIGAQVRFFKDTGAFIVHAGTDNRKVAEAVGVILKELHRAKAELVSDDEFKRAKDFYLGQLMLSLEDTQDQMLWIGESTVSLDRTYTLEQTIEEINRVTRQDLREVAAGIFKEELLNLALIGPLAGKEGEIQKQLHLEG
ncbi:MAG: pitrilysin family protein [Candidatus Omnitrophota bacterium]